MFNAQRLAKPTFAFGDLRQMWAARFCFRACSDKSAFGVQHCIIINMGKPP